MDFKRGRFFVIEGGDASGKATQVGKLYKRLVASDYNVELFDFPQYGKNVFADIVTAYLQGEFGDPLKIDPTLAAIPYGGDRFKAAPFIRAALDKGFIALSNRYTFASAGHQGAKIVDKNGRTDVQAQMNYFEMLRKVEFSDGGFNIPKPDLTLYLKVNPMVSSKLADTRSLTSGVEKDGHESAALEYKVRVVEAYTRLANSDPTWRIIDCMDGDKLLDAESINNKIWQTIKPFLPYNHFSQSDESPRS